MVIYYSPFPQGPFSNRTTRDIFFQLGDAQTFFFLSFFFQLDSRRVEWDQKQNEKTAIDSVLESKKNITNFVTLTA